MEKVQQTAEAGNTEEGESNIFINPGPLPHRGQDSGPGETFLAGDVSHGGRRGVESEMCQMLSKKSTLQSATHVGARSHRTRAARCPLGRHQKGKGPTNPSAV